MKVKTLLWLTKAKGIEAPSDETVCRDTECESQAIKRGRNMIYEICGDIVDDLTDVDPNSVSVCILDYDFLVAGDPYKGEVIISAYTDERTVELHYDAKIIVGDD